MPALNAFEQATLEQLVSFKAKNESDIERFLSSKTLITEAKALCEKWNKNRKKIGLERWK